MYKRQVCLCIYRRTVWMCVCVCVICTCLNRKPYKKGIWEKPKNSCIDYLILMLEWRWWGIRRESKVKIHTGIKHWYRLEYTLQTFQSILVELVYLTCVLDNTLVVPKPLIGPQDQNFVKLNGGLAWICKRIENQFYFTTSSLHISRI